MMASTNIATSHPSFVPTSQMDADPIQSDQQSIVGPSDQYGIHPKQFNGRNISPMNSNHINNFDQFRNGDRKGLYERIPRDGGSKGSIIDGTKVCVVVDSRTPVIIKVPVHPTNITLSDLKHALPAINQPNFKYFFKSSDSEFGIVREEIQEDDCQLPTYRNRVVAWIVTTGDIDEDLDSRFKSESVTDTCNLTYSRTSYDDSGSSILTTDMESTSYFTETDDDSVSCSNYSETTCDTFISQRKNYRCGRSNGDHPSNNYHEISRNSPFKKNGHNRLKQLDNLSSSSSSSSSTSSATNSDATAVQCVTVHIVLTNENFLGLKIYPNTIDGVDEGIYVDGVTEDSALALDGRVEPGDKLIQVNSTNLEDLSNDDAIKVLKDAVKDKGPLKLIVAKFVEASKNDPITGLRDTVQPIDTAAWVAHAQALTIPNSIENANSAASSPSFGSTGADTEFKKSTLMGMNHSMMNLEDIVDHMRMLDIGLELKDREWLKIQIPRAFLGSDLILWLERNVTGITNRREAKKLANSILKEGHIRDPISKKPFSSRSYYTFVDANSAGA